MKTLKQQLLSGAVLRYRPPHGFYTVHAGKSTPVTEATGRAAVQSGLVRPAGKDQHGVYLFALSQKAAHAMQPMHRDSKALPARPASVPPALPDVHPLRRTLHSEIPAPVPADSRTAPGQVQAGAGRLDGSGAQRAGAEGAGKANGVGGGSCAGEGEGVTA